MRDLNWCAEPPPSLLLEGIAQFSRGEYFEPHETLERLWRAETRPVRHRLYQGILQIGVAFHGRCFSTLATHPEKSAGALVVRKRDTCDLHDRPRRVPDPSSDQTQGRCGLRANRRCHRAEGDTPGAFPTIATRDIERPPITAHSIIVTMQ